MPEKKNERFKIIVNPASGRGNGKRVIPGLRESLRKYNINYDLVVTEQPLHATELARQAAEDGYDVVVGVGGDGTANEVVNGLMQVKEQGELKTAIGALGSGRGNDFVYSLGMPADLDEACRVLAEGKRRIIDVGFMRGGAHPEGRYFGNSLGIGFDAMVSIEGIKMVRLGGSLSYLIAVLRTVFLYFNLPHVEIKYGDELLSLPTLLVSIMNGQRQGGLFMMSPESKNDDGLFDICIVRGVSKRRIFTLIPYFFSGTQFSQDEVQLVRADKLTITAVEGVLPAHLDGEIISEAATEFSVKILPLQLEAIVG